MKKLILLLLPLMMSAQVELPQIKVNTTFDFRNAVQGSAPTNYQSELDLLLYPKVLFADSNWEFGIQLERFNRIKFTRFNSLIGYRFQLSEQEWKLFNLKICKGINVVPNVSIFNIIWRGKSEVDYRGKTIYYTEDYTNFFKHISLDINWEITDEFGVVVVIMVEERPDSKVVYNNKEPKESTHVGVYYKF